MANYTLAGPPILIGTSGGTVPYQYVLTSGDSSPIANTAAETAFDKSISLPANTLNKAGARIVVSIMGIHSTDAAVATNMRCKVRVGGAGKEIFNRNGAPQLGAPNFGWAVLCEAVVRSAGASATIQSGYGSYGVVGGNPETITQGIVSTFSLDTTVAQTVDVTLTWSVADTDNTATLRSFVVTIFPTAFGTF